MKTWIWITIIVALAVIAFFIGKSAKGGCGCKDEKKEVVDTAAATKKTGINSEESKKS